MFNHRVISLFYRAWVVNQQAVSFDRPELDRFAVYTATLIGLGTSHLRDRDEARGLFLDRVHDARVAVTDVAHAVVRAKVQIFGAFGVWAKALIAIRKRVDSRFILNSPYASILA